MQKHLLVTISDDISLLYGVRFVNSFFKNKAEVKVTLFYVAPRADIAGQVKHSGEDLDKKAAEAGRKKGEGALAVSQRLLCDRGFPPENITNKLLFRQLGTVKDIIKEAKQGQYDAVVLGRRGYALFETLLSTSVSREILDRDLPFPVWVCRMPEENRKNVLLCVDGSEASLRMADHVGFMLEAEEDHSVTLFLVDTGEEGDKDAILDEASRKLKENGLPEERIRTLVIRSTNVARAILDEAEKRAYATIAVGRAGLKKSPLKELLIGSRSMKLLEKVEKATLWVSS